MKSDLTSLINVEVKDIMTEKVITIKSSSTMREAIETMVEEDVECLPVTENGSICGLITFRDVMAKVLYESRNPDRTEAKEIMTKPVTTCSPDATVLEVVKVMKNEHLRRLPVVDADGKLLGIVTNFDLAVLGWKM